MSFQRFVQVIPFAALLVACGNAPTSPAGRTPPANGTFTPGPQPPPGPSGACELTPPPEGSWSLREREQWATLLRQTQAYLDETNRRCGTQICASIAYETFRGHFEAQNVAGLDGEGVDHVVAPIAVVHQICEDGAIQTNAIRAKVRRVDIRWGGTGPSSWAFDRGVLATAITPTAESSFDYRAEMRGPNGLRQRL